jgi:glycogen debranching enzyme
MNKGFSQKVDFEMIKLNLPEPILDDHKDWIELYWKAWAIAYDKIQYGTKENGFVESYLDEGFNPNIFQWDTDFMMMFARYGFNVYPSIISLDNFYRKQHNDGFICREIREKDGSDYWKEDSKNAINPPLFSWAEWEYYKITGDKNRFKKALPNLIKYFDWIKKNRRWKNGLYWSTGWASGMDNSPRAGNNVHDHYNFSWIDISAQQALNAKCISKIAKELNENKIEKRFEKEYKNLSNLINSKMWNKRNGIYFDLDQNGKLSTVKTIASFWPLLAEIPDKNRVDILVFHLLNPKEFLRMHSFSTLSADHPLYNPKGGYWRGSVWAPTNYMAIKGLELYGYENEARSAAANHIQNIYEVYKKTGTIWENYAPDTIAQGSDSRGNFVGWSGCGPIALLIENILGFRPYAPKDSLYWKLALTEKHGIKNLKFGDIITTIIVEKREDPRMGCNVTVVSNKDYKLSVFVFDTLFRKQIKKGTNEFTLVLE